MRKRIELTGKRFGRLTVLGLGYTHKNKVYWYIKCDCGNIKTTQGNNLKSGSTRSCGCLQREIATRHGMEKSKEYKTWACMKQRCLNVNNKDFKNYGGRGIKICDSWINNFGQFIKDMGLRPEGCSIDRIDNNKGYSSDNCKWSTPKEQANNKKR